MSVARRPPTTQASSFSLGQLAKRWKCTVEEVGDYIKFGQLTCCLILTDTDALIPEAQHTRKVTLNGHHRLPQKDAVQAFTGERERDLAERRARWPRSLAGHMAAKGVPVLEAPPTSEVVVTEPNIFGTVSFWPSRGDLCVLRTEVERFETECVGVEDDRPLRKNQRHKERCRAIAATIWEREPTLTIEDMIDRAEITRIGQENTTYGRETIRSWIKDLCPNREPGRRPKNPRAQQK